MKASLSATAHGKGCWDGLGASVKRYRKRYSVAHPDNNIVRNSLGLYTVCKEKFKDSMKIFHLSSEEMIEILTKRNVKERADRSKWVPETRRTHYFEEIKDSTNQLRAKMHSLADKSRIVQTC